MGKIRIDVGFVLRGKWNRNQYKILCLLGKGGIGRVYKVKDINTGQIWALKISGDLQSITKEHNLLVKFQNLNFIPKIKELDDVDGDSQSLHFIVMEYIEGYNLKEYGNNKSISIKDIIGLGIIIGKMFHILHQRNLVFGDLKLENLMIDKKHKTIKIIDLGGVTPVGFGIKEFTPLYDRASWNMGLRKADKEYDLFSLSMLMVTLLLKNKVVLQNHSVDKLVLYLKTVDIPPLLLNLIHKGLKQKDLTFEEFLSRLQEIYKKEYFQWEKRKKINAMVDKILASSIILFFMILLLYTRKSIGF